MMENAGTHYLIKTQTQIAHLFDGELVKLKVCQIVFSLELFRAPDTDPATVNPRNLSFGPPQCILGGLRCSTTGNEDGLVRPVGSRRPKEMKVSAASLRVLPESPILVEIVDRPGIRIAVVELPNVVCDPR